VRDHDGTHVEVTCRTCHRGVERPLPLSTILIAATLAGGADSGLRTYASLRDRYYGRDAYDFGEGSLNVAAFRVARARQYADALALLDANEEMYPNSSGLSVFRGNILLMSGDTTEAAAAYREAIARDSANGEARGRLREIGRSP
jgi:tetratricopeptide (TPR) repeat protein